MHLQNYPELFQLFLEHTPGAVAMFDREMRYIATSRRWLTDYGVLEQSLIGRSHYEVFPEIPDKWKAVHQRCLAGAVESCEADSFVRVDGSVEWVKWESRPWYDQNGEIGGIIFFSEVITDRKNTEVALRASEARFQKLAANLPGVIYQFLLGRDGSKSCSYISSGCRQLFELEPENVQQDFTQIFAQVHPDDRRFLSDSMAISADTMLPWVWEGRITTPSGKLKWVRAVSRPEKQASGDILWDGLMIDISDRVLAQHQAEFYAQTHTAAIAAQNQAQQLEKTLSELTRTQTQLVQSEKMSSLGQLVAGVAHEINNPVNFIYGNLAHASGYTQDLIGLVKLYQKAYPQLTPEILEEIEVIDLDFLITDLPKLLSSMKVGADRIRSIVRSLRNFSRHDEAEIKAVDIHEGIDSTLMILQHRLKNKPDRTPIEVIKQYGNLPLIECCAGQLNQVFMNLLANAIDALEEGMGNREWGIGNKSYPTPYTLPPTPQIRITTEILDHDRIVIRIADNGSGMTPEVQKHLFDPFFTTKPVGVGTGLGLSISYQIVVEKHGGQLYCQSELGQGTEFVIEIPIYQKSNQ